MCTGARKRRQPDEEGASSGGAASVPPLTEKPKELGIPMLDGLTATMLDERILRGEPQLQSYWSERLSADPKCSLHITEHRKLVEVGALLDRYRALPYSATTHT